MYILCNSFGIKKLERKVLYSFTTQAGLEIQQFSFYLDCLNVTLSIDLHRYCLNVTLRIDLHSLCLHVALSTDLRRLQDLAMMSVLF